MMRSQPLEFPFALPAAYRWLVDRGLVGREPNTALQPWYFLPLDEVFCLNDRWPDLIVSRRLFAFARRQDCDDLACFAVGEDNLPPRVFLVHAWTPEGYQVVAEFDSVWDWLKAVVSDIEDWVALDEESRG
jgi:hypothetical protein